MTDGTPGRPTRNVELGASGEEFQNIHEFVRKARARLNQNAWDYIVGASETETTMRRNRMALDEIAFRPRVLRNVAKVDASTQVFGRRLRLPVMIAPVGALEIFDPDSGAAVARGVGQFGAAHMLSSVSEPGLEATAKAAPGARKDADSRTTHTDAPRIAVSPKISELHDLSQALVNKCLMAALMREAGWEDLSGKRAGRGFGELAPETITRVGSGRRCAGVASSR